MNRYSPWKYSFIILLVGLGVLFALPNLYDKDPSLQISASGASEVSELTEFQVSTALEEAGIAFKSMKVCLANLTIRFNDT